MSKVGDGTSDAASAIGEHAFGVGFDAGVAWVKGSARWAGRSDAHEEEKHRAWSRYDPPEDIKALA